MSTDSAEVTRPLPERPNLRHLKDQAKDLFKSGGAKSITEAQFRIARLYGFASWPISLSVSTWAFSLGQLANP